MARRWPGAYDATSFRRFAPQCTSNRLALLPELVVEGGVEGLEVRHR